MNTSNKIFKDKIKELASVVDNEQVPIDKEILETIAALNLNGIPTNVSCAGHTGYHPLNYPFIRGWDPNRPIKKYTNNEKVQETKKYKAWSKKNIVLRRKIRSMLREFYSKRKNIPKTSVYLSRESLHGYFIMVGKWNTKKMLINNTKNELKIKQIKSNIVAAQKELKDFTEFLKKKL